MPNTVKLCRTKVTKVTKVNAFSLIYFLLNWSDFLFQTGIASQ